jgi:hypothetical protein
MQWRVRALCETWLARHRVGQLADAHLHHTQCRAIREKRELMQRECVHVWECVHSVSSLMLTSEMPL